ncbi:hypothetical protein ISS07_04380, partial [Candidatus Woesearchaeota archaeon]|nr:hypothetical protein [Candidatus Woesearchaeota archaeon]
LFIAHKEMRLLIPILPFLFILSSYGIFKFVNNFKKNKYILLSLFVVSSFVLTLPQLRYDALENNFSSFQDFSKNHKNVWISNPKFIIADNAKAELMYYPTYSSKLNFLLENVNLAENVLIDTCDLVCEDNLCKEKDKELFDYFFKNFNIVLDKKVSDCNYYIFSR